MKTNCYRFIPQLFLGNGSKLFLPKIAQTVAKAISAAGLLVVIQSPCHGQISNSFNFNGTSRQNQIDILGFSFIPPDTMGAMGTTQYLETTNGLNTIYNRSDGSILSRVNSDTFWQNRGQNGSGGDQRVLFDINANRWVATGFDDTQTRVVIGVSDTSDALGNWRTTSISVPTLTATNIPDYATLGIDDKAIYIGTNNFDPDYVNSGLFVMPRATLFGLPSTGNNVLLQTDFTYLQPAPNHFTLQAPVNWGTNSDNQTLVLSQKIANPSGLGGFNISNVANAGAASSTFTGDIAGLATYDLNNPDARQPENVQIEVDTLDARISANVYEVNGKVYGVHTVTVTGQTNTSLEWFVIDASTGLRIDSGIIGNPNYDYFQGTIAVNDFGEAVISYNRSGSSSTDGQISIMA